MAAKQALQIISIPHRPVPQDAEINKDLAPSFEILLKYVDDPLRFLSAPADKQILEQTVS